MYRGRLGKGDHVEGDPIACQLACKRYIGEQRMAPAAAELHEHARPLNSHLAWFAMIEFKPTTWPSGSPLRMARNRPAAPANPSLTSMLSLSASRRQAQRSDWSSPGYRRR